MRFGSGPNFDGRLFKFKDNIWGMTFNVFQFLYSRMKVQGKRTAEDWAKLLALTADMMDEKSRTMEFEKFAAIQIRVNVRRRDTRR